MQADTKCLINVDFLRVPTIRRLVTSPKRPHPSFGLLLLLLLSGRLDYDRYGCRVEPFYLILHDVTLKFFFPLKLTSFSKKEFSTFRMCPKIRTISSFQICVSIYSNLIDSPFTATIKMYECQKLRFYEIYTFGLIYPSNECQI